MGLLISINGADFTPYHHVDSILPAIARESGPHAIDPVRRKDQPPESFEQVMKQNKVRHFNATVEEVKTPARHATRAKDLMNNSVINVSQSSRIEEAKSLLQTKSIRHLPVVNERDAIVGMISDRDLMLAQSDQQAVTEIMSRDLIVAQADTPLKEIAKVLIRHRINSVPVVDDKKKVIGIITTTDLLYDLMKKDPINLWA